MILEAAGYDVVNASSGAQALGIFSTVLVDLVVLDYSMPGVNGGEVAKVFKTRRPELPILMVSGRPVEEEVFLCVDGFLVKGESPGAMLRKIEQLLSDGSATHLPEEIKSMQMVAAMDMTAMDAGHCGRSSQGSPRPNRIQRFRWPLSAKLTGWWKSERGRSESPQQN